MIKAVIFDFFGVIYPDLSSRWLDEEVENRDSFEHEYKEICRRNDLGFLNNGKVYDELSRITNIPREDVHSGIKKQMVLDQELIEYIRSVKHNYKLTILSNCGAGFLSKALEKEGIAELFDDVVVSADVGLIKPDPRIFELALDRLGVSADEAIFVDDNQNNINAANSLGIKSLLFTNTHKFIHDINELI